MSLNGGRFTSTGNVELPRAANEAFTLAYWTYATSGAFSLTANSAFITQDDNFGTGDFFITASISNSGMFYGGFVPTAGQNVGGEFTMYSTPFQLGWNSIVFVNESSGVRSVYVNGHQTQQSGVTVFFDNLTEIRLNLGGQVAEWAWWDNNLTDEQARMYGSGVPANLIAPQDLYAYCPCISNEFPEDTRGNLNEFTAVNSYAPVSGHPAMRYGLKGQYPHISNSNQLPFYMRGHLPYHSGDGEFDSSFSWSYYNQLQGEPPGWHMSLYLGADYNAASGDVPLYTSAHRSINNLDGAYDDSYDYDFDISNPLPLFLQVVNQLPEPTGAGDTIFGLNLFIKGFSNARSGNNNLPLFTFGFDGTGIIDSVDLFTEGFATTQITKNATLYLKAIPSGQANINLFLNAGIDKETNTVPLYMQVLSMESGYNFPLTMWNPSNIASGGPFNLFTYSQEGTGIYHSFDMVTLGHSEFQASPCNLYAHAIGSGNSNVNLYMHGREVDSRQGSVNLFINNELRPTNYVPLTVFNGQGVMSGDLTLFLANEYGDTSESVTLFMGADGPFGGSSTMNLYMNRNSESLSFNMPLFVDGSGIGELTGEITLVTSGNYSSFNTTTLYTLGFTDDSAFMPMSITGRSYPTESGFFPLFSWGADESGIYNFTSLYTAGPDPTGFRNDNIRLFLKQESSVSQTSMVNLFAKSVGNTDGSITYSNEVMLTMYNNAAPYSGQFTLFMNGPSGTEPFIPHSSTVNLVMWRQIESTALTMPFAIAGPEGSNSGVPLFMEAQPRPTGTITLFLNGGTSGINDLVKLYTHGF